MWAIIGLGNPGRAYARTRHNAGFLLVRRIARKWGVRLSRPRFQAKIGEITRGGQQILLALPQTFMNNSGLAVKEIIHHRAIPLEQMVIIYDDLDIPLGEIRVRAEGSSGGHRGVESIIRELGATRFPRIRLGIGPLPEGVEAAEFVLSPFTSEEKLKMERSLEKAEAALELILAGQINEAMSRFNQRIKVQ
ncbi:MAG: aminoacyl-tRNA hydrolase [Candidatus Aminicenantes bacterium]|nr:aminoacyl-tRNA hydrolase [Candidatus Aminicenantes bacterium]RLE04620.1 MAG: aminoacyl-tRNA hydrolase [Candidatus Aminicenantes bacterium]